MRKTIQIHKNNLTTYLRGQIYPPLFLKCAKRVQYRYRLRLSHLLGCFDLTWERSGQKLVLLLEGGVVAVMT